MSSLIGQFGIGLLSAFVVAHRVVVQTRSCKPDSAAWRWECWGDKEYTLAPDEFVSIGTRITLQIDSKHREVLDLDLIRNAVRKYADFIPVPIQLNDEGRINAMNAPWHRAYASDGDQLAEYTNFVQRRFPKDFALSVIPVDIADPYPVKGVLYISDRRRNELSASGRVDIYQARMFITANHPELLPLWAKFVSGVIDSPAFTPTAARDNVQTDAPFRTIRDVLGRLVIDHLKKMASENERRFQQIMLWHHYQIKGMALQADDFFRAVADLLPFQTNERDLMSLREYLERAVKSADGRRTILYFSEGGTATQYFMLANAKRILVINASYAHEASFLQKFAKEFPDIKLEQLDFAESNLIFQELTADETKPFRELITEFREHMPVLGSRCKVVRFSPTNVPAVVTLTELQRSQQELDAFLDNPAIPLELSDLLRHHAADRHAIPITVHLNADNETIRALSKLNLRSEEVGNALTAILNNAMMLAQYLITPRNAEAIFTQFNRVIDLLIKQTQEVTQLQEQVRKLAAAVQPDSSPGELTAHVSCFVAFDPRTHNHVFETLRDILQDRPYFWEVMRADELVEKSDYWPNLTNKMRRAHCFIVELSNANPNVVLELGMLMVLSRPYLLLHAGGLAGGEGVGLNLAGKVHERYDSMIQPDAHKETLTEILQRQADFQLLLKSAHAKFLSPVLFRGCAIQVSVIEPVCRAYQTVKAFLDAKPAEVVARTGVRPPSIITVLQEYAREYCGLGGDAE